MDREKMIDDVVADLRAWHKRDPEGFWSHVEDLERAHLAKMDDKELEAVHIFCPLIAIVPK